MVLLYSVAAVLIGTAFALQPPINAAGARILGSPVAAAVVSVTITLVSLVAIQIATGGGFRPGSLGALPWWMVLGGVIGAAVVAGSAAIAPVTGAAVLFVCMIAGQLLGSTLIDHFGAFGMTPRPVGITRLIGLGLVLAGVLLVRRG